MDSRIKPVSAYTITGEYIKTYPSAKFAANELNISASAIQSAARGYTQTCNGCFWRYYECAQLPAEEIRYTPPRRKAVSQYTLEGIFVKTFPCVALAAMALGVSDTSISHAATGVSNQCAGFLWRYYECTHLPAEDIIITVPFKRAVSQYTKNGIFVRTYPSVTSAAKAVWTTPSSISSAATGKTKTCCGHLWRYYECAQLPSSDIPRTLRTS